MGQVSQEKHQEYQEKEHQENQDISRYIKKKTRYQNSETIFHLPPTPPPLPTALSIIWKVFVELTWSR